MVTVPSMPRHARHGVSSSPPFNAVASQANSSKPLTIANGPEPGGVRTLATIGQQRDRLSSLLATLRHARRDEQGTRTLATEALALAESLNDRSARAFSLKELGWCKLAAGLYSEAIRDLQAAFKLMDDLGEWADAAEVMLALGRAQLGMLDYSRALASYQQSLGISRDHADPVGMALAETALGNVHVDIGEYVPGLEHHFEALRLREHGRDGDAIGVTYMDIGFVYAQMGELEKALDFFTKGLELFRDSGNNYLQARALGNISAVYLSHGRLEAALEYALRALIVQEGLGDAAGVAEALISIATIHERAGRLAEALDNFQKARTVAEPLNRPTLDAAALIGIGNLRRRRGDFWNAVAELDKAQVIARGLGDRRLEYQIHEALARAFEEMGAADKALEHYKMFARIREELGGEEKRKAVAEIEVRFALEKAEREREIYRLQAEQLRSEVELKTRELTAMALGIVQRNTMLDALKERVAEAIAERGSGTAGDGVVVKKVLEQIEAARDSESDWKAFEEQLDQLHGDFIRTLSSHYPELTPTELKICALLKANLATKDIAKILYLSERTVENHRYRLRKKMGLGADSNLTLHLASL